MAIRLNQPAYEILDKIAKIRDKGERRIQIRSLCAEHRVFATIIQYAYHPEVEFDLPRGPIPESLIKRTNHDDASVIYRHIRKLPMYFVNSHVPKWQKENNFAGLACDVAGRDFDLLVAMKDKKLPWKTLNKGFCLKALPELFPAAAVAAADLEPDEG